MNSPSPIVPKAPHLEQHHQARTTLKVKIFCALGLNVAVLLVLLMQGCKREQPQQANELAPVFADTNPPPLDVNGTNLPPQTLVDTNPPLAIATNPPVAVIPEPALQPNAVTSEHVIQKGDNFSTIAKKYGVSVKAIQAANPTVDPAKLQIGKKIIIPAASAVAAPPAATGTAAAVVDHSGLYKVKSGDTLGKIAAEHHTTVKAIQSANGLIDSRIKVGQQLKLPVKSAAPEPAPVAPVPAR